jgi:hypothetical protein
LAVSSAIASLYGAEPIVLVSSRLPEAGKTILCGLTALSFQVSLGEIALGRGLTALPGEVAAAFAADLAERRALVAYFATLGRAPPVIAERPSLEKAAEAIAQGLAARLAEAGRREAQLREALISMRIEAEETRAAMARLIERSLAAMSPQALTALQDDEPSPAEEDLAFDGPFEIAVATSVEIYGLSALSLMLAPERIAADDRLDIVLRGEEQNALLGAWRVPLTALAAGRRWLTLDLPLSLASARQSAVIELRGRLQPASRLAIARAAAAEAPALRLYAARAPRLADAPFWNWPDLAPPRGVEAAALPAESWTGARLIGRGARVGGAQRGEIKLRLPGGAGALLIFPAVALDRAAGIAARLRAPGQDEIVAALGLLPPDSELGDDVATVQGAALAWSALQSVRNEAAGIVLPVAADAGPRARVVLALRNTNAESSEAPVVNCDGLWLLAARSVRPPADFAALGPPTRIRDTGFDEVRLEEFYEIEGYQHLDLKLAGLTEGERRWPSVKFKLAREGPIPAMEFRLGGDRAPCFENWPGVQSDAYGPVFKINGPREFVMALTALPVDKDRRLLVTLADVMPDVVRALIARGELAGEAAQSWLTLARTLRGWTL